RCVSRPSSVSPESHSGRGGRSYDRVMSEAWPLGMPTVGATAELRRTVAAHDIELFTELSGDRNPLHYDKAAAGSSRFGEIVVQGGITSAVLNAVLAEN